ncbi:type VII secretion protein EccB [Streptomyces albogriseolus]|uniref:type VII secretion protein EccB n=1 Tax=Streptomyces albogriseolus TaxID=1887 RepID=UPI0022509B4B|nr:type VII secretion protein EccB [Streptomyces viridodiastaticus]MCX4622728.1 type VII secretion protein EccB [Streptomyces viridodiastaticus]
MASRRDELNAYTFAKRRMLAAFLQPSPSGSEEEAPRPLRAVVPSLVVGVLVLGVFGAWGMFKPTAPAGWDEPGTRVIVGKQSTTRYVVLKTDGVTRLHPVRGGKDGKGTVQEATFVLADADRKRTDDAGRLSGGDALYVKTRAGERYLVDARGTAYVVTGGKPDPLTIALVGSREPQLVTEEWLATLHEGDPLRFPELPSGVGGPAEVPGQLSEDENRVGMVLRTETGEGTQYYVVLPGKVQPVTEFTAWLLISSPQTAELNMNGKARTVGLQDFTPDPEPFEGQAADWPDLRVRQVNSPDGARDTVCSVLRDVGKDNSTVLSTWAGKDYPVEITADGTSTYVTPGTGQLYTQIQGTASDAGSLFLVTDTGLRYAVQANGDSDSETSDIGADPEGGPDGSPEPSEAQVKLGYQNVRPARIPLAWSEFLAKGPRLDTNSARQPQGS